ncbi:MAG TPA: hypothetical protein P5250_07450 [Bacteroidales bacterium]|nr:hypothetical protein [Bacteroidales bacterium]
MKNILLLYIKKLLVLTFLLYLIGYVIYFILPKNLYTPAFPFIIAFYFIVNLITQLLILKNTYNKKASKFIRWFMGVSFIKLALYIIVMVLYALIYRNEAKLFVITYCIVYVFYMCFDIIVAISAYDRLKSI